MKLQRMILFFCCVFLGLRSYCQRIELIDTITPSGYIKLVNQVGDRYYGTDKIKDSIIINGTKYNLPPGDTMRSSPNRHGWPHLVGVQIEDSVFFKQHIAGNLIGNGQNFYSLTAIDRDSLVSGKHVFHNAAVDSGGWNMILLNYSNDGELIDHKQWELTCNCTISPLDLANIGEDLLMTGWYFGNPEYDEIQLEDSSGWHTMLTGRLSSEGEFIWIKELKTLGTTAGTDLVVSSKNEIMVAGISSESSWIPFCGDTIENKAISDWGTQFMYMLTYDENGNCMDFLTMDYDFGEISSISTDILTTDSYILAGNYYGTHIGFDSIIEYNSSDDVSDNQGFIVKTSSELVTERLFQLEGSSGDKWIRSIAIDDDDNIWITGSANVDTLIVGNKILTRGGSDQYIGFLSKLTSDFEHLFTFQSDYRHSWLKKGEDGYIYYKRGSNLYKIIDSTSNIDDNAISNTLEQGFVYPNPSSDIINLEISEKIDQVTLINTTGAIITELPATKSINISNLESGLYFVKIQTSSGQYVDRFVVK